MLIDKPDKLSLLIHWLEQNTAFCQSSVENVSQLNSNLTDSLEPCQIRLLRFSPLYETVKSCVLPEQGRLGLLYLLNLMNKLFSNFVEMSAYKNLLSFKIINYLNRIYSSVNDEKEENKMGAMFTFLNLNISKLLNLLNLTLA